MRVAVLFSGGKDSTLALHEVAGEGHEISTLVSVVSSNPDSFMFHVPGIELTELQAEAMRLPRLVVRTSGIEEREVDELLSGLRGLEVDAIVTGAIQSEYQRKRFGRVASELEVEHMTPLWKRDPWEVLRKEISTFDVFMTGCSADGLTDRWLGKVLEPTDIAELEKINKRYGVHPAGEGGEYETAVLDAPMFQRKLSIAYDKEWKSSSGKLVIKKAGLVPK